MAFVLKQSDTYTWPVTFEIPNSGGRHEKHTFDAEFKRLPQSKVAPMISKLDGLDAAADLEQITDMAAEIMVGWSAVTDNDGKEIPFSQKALAELLEIPLVAVAILRHYFDSIKGAKRKN